MLCGLLGKKLSHSFSPQIHHHLGDYSYNLYEIQPENLSIFFDNEPFQGINVTMPYKKDVIPFCDELSDTAAALGAVNTIVRRNGKLIGHNTDYYGFLSMVKKSGLNVSQKKVLVLGSGGASATVTAVLKELNATPVIISRNGNNNYSNLNLHSDAAIIVNTTPVGMYPNNGTSPIDLSIFPTLEGVLDLIYNPNRTELLMQAEKRGIIAENGLWMLVAQAKESAQWFLNQDIDENIIYVVYNKLIKETQNISLIGMPGCGKSTVGKLLSKKMKRTFIDIDKEVESAADMKIPDIFRLKGELAFRKLESEALERIGKQSGLIISTGGGCVTVPKNYAFLHQNGYIVRLQRDLDKLTTDGRPLSISSTLCTMFEMRNPLYEQFQDVEIDNNGHPEQTANTILSWFEGEI